MANESSTTDVIVIGGGPAGVAAAIWCADLGISPLILERESEPGGQLLVINNPVTNYPGLRTANGRELRDLFIDRFATVGQFLQCRSEVTSIDLKSKRIVAGSDLQAKSIVIATGVRRRTLDITGETEFRGRGILESGAASKDTVRGKSVAIVGGGDAALENAVMLGETAREVTIIHRRNAFTARKEFVQNVEEKGNIQFRFMTRLKAIKSADGGTGLTLELEGQSSRSSIDVDYLLIRIGVVPNTELFTGQIELDRDGYIVVDADCRTSLANVYAIGDVASPRAPTISTAVGMAAIAAKAIRRNI